MSHARIVGRGRAGSALAAALSEAGWQIDVRGRGDNLTAAAVGTDAVILAVPDGAIADVARAIESRPETLVLHLSGAVDLEALRPHGRRAGMHPLVPLVGGERAAALLRGAWFGVEGDDGVLDVVAALDGRVLHLTATDRARYHAAAVIASNHMVALMGQVERMAAELGVPSEAFLDLAAASLENVAALGPTAALTGPVARGDWDTVRHHLGVLHPAERPAYLALAAEAARLAARDLPADLDPHREGVPA